MSSFASHHVHSLLRAAQSVSTTPADEGSVLTSQDKTEQFSQEEELYSLLLQLKSPLDGSLLRSTLVSLSEQRSDLVSGESSAIRATLQGRIIVGLYAEALDQWLKEASDADTEAEWWDGVARSSQSISWYFLATLPERLKRSIETIINALRARNIPIRPSSFSPQAVRDLFPRMGSLRPTALSTAFFPHLIHQQHSLFSSPLELTRQECQKRREGLTKLRDARALQLGRLLTLKAGLETAIREEGPGAAAGRLREAIISESPYSSPPPSSELQIQSPIVALHDLAFTTLPSHTSSHNTLFASLARPSRLTLLWPRLALIPPLSLLFFRLAYNSRESIAESVLRAHDTLKGFWFGYVVEPVRGILDTVRSGGDDGARIVSQEAVRADLESLERMALSLGKDKLSLNDTQLQQLAEQIRQGDLTPVLRIYEEDIKAPVRTALTGSLVRSLLIQIQKAKVDLDQALSGIDKLLKSQELTFAFVGVAPALAIVYAALSGARTLWSGGRSGKKYGGRREREGAWIAIRRVEHLLVTSPGDHAVRTNKDAGAETGTDALLSPLTSGLLLIALARLRSYAEARLPDHSLLRAGVLSDIADLESPELGRAEKLRVVERMWRSWGSVLGWSRMGQL